MYFFTKKTKFNICSLFVTQKSTFYLIIIGNRAHSLLQCRYCPAAFVSRQVE